MCDICLKEQTDEFKSMYVLTKTESAWHGNFTTFQYKVIGSVQVSVCEQCYHQIVPATTDELLKNKKGLRSKLRQWWCNMNRLSKEKVIASLAFDKFTKLYPEILGRMDGGSVFGWDEKSQINRSYQIDKMIKNQAGALGRGPRYNIWTLEAWNKKLRFLQERNK